MCVTESNLVAIGQTFAEIWPMFDFSRWRSSAILNLLYACLDHPQSICWSLWLCKIRLELLQCSFNYMHVWILWILGSFGFDGKPRHYSFYLGLNLACSNHRIINIDKSNHITTSLAATATQYIGANSLEMLINHEKIVGIALGIAYSPFLTRLLRFFLKIITICLVCLTQITLVANTNQGKIWQPMTDWCISNYTLTTATC